MEKFNNGMLLFFNTISPSVKEDLKKIFRLLKIIKQRRKIEESHVGFFKKVFLRLGLVSYSPLFKRLLADLEEHRLNVYSNAAKLLNTNKAEEYFKIGKEVESVDYDLKLRLDNYFLAMKGLYDPFRIANFSVFP
ncbi:MAG: hypothetical protein KGI58_03270 [Patescibacteria group bacterium]|nr:hypothetical protein [Patescibacteria group bacterium]